MAAGGFEPPITISCVLIMISLAVFFLLSIGLANRDKWKKNQ